MLIIEKNEKDAQKIVQLRRSFGNWRIIKGGRGLFFEFHLRNGVLKLENLIKNMEEKYSVAFNFQEYSLYKFVYLKLSIQGKINLKN